MELGLLKTGLRGLQFLWCLLLTALIGNVIALSVRASGSATAAINFTMFVIVVSWLIGIFGLLTRLFPSLERPSLQLPADALATLLTFISAVVLSAKLGAINCGAIDDKRAELPGNWIAWGSANDEKRCREIQAATVFMWFLFICFVGSAFFEWKDSRRGFSMPSSRPSMSQLGV